jgi:hypothetical protein
LRSPIDAATGARSAAGMSCTAATTPASVAPPCPYAKTIIATHVAHSALLNIANAASIRRRGPFRATTRNTSRTAAGYDRTRRTTVNGPVDTA